MDVWRREDPLLRGDAAGCADHILSRTNRLAVLGVAVAGVVGMRIADSTAYAASMAWNSASAPRSSANYQYKSAAAAAVWPPELGQQVGHRVRTPRGWGVV